VLTGKPYVYGAVFRFEGQASVFDARRGPCYRCIFPQPPALGTTQPTSRLGLFGVLPGTIGTIQATEALKLILGIGEPLIAKLLIYNALDLNFETIDIPKNPNCLICSPHPQITNLLDSYE
jgi:molybdopterin/thiamine biosynthesis adenylyltransferase